MTAGPGSHHLRREKYVSLRLALPAAHPPSFVPTKYALSWEERSLSKMTAERFQPKPSSKNSSSIYKPILAYKTDPYYMPVLQRSLVLSRRWMSAANMSSCKSTLWLMYLKCKRSEAICPAPSPNSNSLYCVALEQVLTS